MLRILFRTFLLYVLLIAVMRLTGKRQIGELQLSELVTTLLISEIAATPIATPQSSLWHAVLPILFIACLELAASHLVTKSDLAKRIFDGAPSFLIKHGCIDQKELLRQRISLEELLSALRQQGFVTPAEVSYAIMEQNGQVSVFSKEDGNHFAHPLIIDGKINPAAGKAAGKSADWVMMRMEALGCPLGDAFLYTLSDDGTEFLARRSNRSEGN